MREGRGGAAGIRARGDEHQGWPLRFLWHCYSRSMELVTSSRAVRRSVTVAVSAAGAASLLAQVVLLREILASSQGNELVLGMVLALWLLLTGLASAAGGRGMAGSVVGLLPPCFLSGLGFPGALAALSGQGRAAILYGAETLGSAAAGLLFHFLLADRLSSAWTAFVAGAICAGASLPLAFRRQWVGAIASLTMIVLSAIACPSISSSLASARFPGEQVLSLQPSRYGLLAVVARGPQRVFFHDGALLFTSEDEIAAEESVHLPLLLHANPRRILLVGGGLGGGLVQALKHKPEHLDYVEMDPGVFPLARKFADEEP